MHIVAKTCPNNKFQIKRYRLAEGYLRAKNIGDSSSVKENTYIASKLSELEANRKIASFYSDIEQSRADINLCNNAIQGDINFSETHLKPKQPQFEHCLLPQKIDVFHAELANAPSWLEHLNYADLGSQNAIALDLLKKSQQSKKIARPWGKKQSKKEFNWSAGEKIKDGGAIIDRYVGKNSSTMITCTLPGDTAAAKDCIARWSGWIVNRILQVIRRASSVEIPCYWFFVWEHQKRGALHLHFCLGWLVSKEKRELLAKQIVDKFYECLLELKNKDNIDCFQRPGYQGTWRYNPDKWQSDIKQIEKSVASYFAKYCKKNAKYNGNNVEKPDSKQRTNDKTRANSFNGTLISYPSRYWGSSRTVKDRIKQITIIKRYEVYSQGDAEVLLTQLRATVLDKYNLKSFTSIDFQIEDPKNGIIWASGTTETYSFEPLEYTDFWISFRPTGPIDRRAEDELIAEFELTKLNFV
jgi:cell fate (sporulation/competence/biofilm development) regulator YmcA (YheA/YmcA/DUF963 family)